MQPVTLFNFKTEAIISTEIFSDKKSRLRLRLAVSAFYFCSGLCFSSWASRIPDLKSALHLSAAGLGTVLLALPAGQLCTLPFSGRLVTHFGSKRVISFAVILYALELTNLSKATQQWQLALALFLFGVCANLCNIAINTQGISTEKIFERSIMSSFHGAWSLAGFCGALIGLTMVSFNISPQIHFYAVALFIIPVSLFTLRFLADVRHPKPDDKKIFSKPDPVLVQLGIIGFCSMATEGAMFDWSGVYFKEVVKVPPALVIMGYASFMVMMATGRFAGDGIIERIGRKRMLQLSGISIATGLFLAVLFPYLFTATAGFLLVGFGVSSVVPTVYSTAGKISAAPGRALASIAGISFLGFLMGPPLIGYIAQAAGLQYSFAVIALIGFSITLLVSRLQVFR